MGIKAVDNMCTLWTIRKITHSLQTYMKHVALEGIEYAPWWWSNSGDCSYNTGKEFLKVSSTGLDKLVLFRCTHWDWVKEKGNRSQQVSKEFYPLMLYPYLPYPSQLPSPEAEIGFLTSGFLLYNTRGWSVHILAVLCILIISDLRLSLWESTLLTEKDI